MQVMVSEGWIYVAEIGGEFGKQGMRIASLLITAMQRSRRHAVPQVVDVGRSPAVIPDSDATAQSQPAVAESSGRHSHSRARSAATPHERLLWVQGSVVRGPL